MREIKSRRNQFRFQFQTTPGLLFIIKLFEIFNFFLHFRKKRNRNILKLGFRILYTQAA